MLYLIIVGGPLLIGLQMATIAPIWVAVCAGLATFVLLLVVGELAGRKGRGLGGLSVP